MLNSKALLQWKSVKTILKTKTTVLKIAFGVSEVNPIFLLQGLAYTYLKMTFRGTGVTTHSHAANLMPAAKPTRHAAYPEPPPCPVVAHNTLQWHVKPAWSEPRPSSGFKSPPTCTPRVSGKNMNCSRAFS